MIYIKAVLYTVVEITIIGAIMIGLLHAVEYLINTMGPNGFLGGTIFVILGVVLIKYLYLTNLDHIRGKEDRKNDLRFQ